MKGSVDRRLIIATEFVVAAVEEMKQQKVDWRRRN